MSISLPSIRLGHLRPERPARKPKHSAPAEAERLRRRLMWADLLIKTQQVQIDDAERALAAANARPKQLEELVVRQQVAIDDLTAERDLLAEQLLALRLRFGTELAAEANANAVTVPPMLRDTTAIEDQATGPINVRALWDARDAGLLAPLRPVLDPGHI